MITLELIISAPVLLEIVVDNGYVILPTEMPPTIKGDPFVYSDFTPEQLEALKVKGDPFTFADFTPEQLILLKGNAFTFADFTPEQIEALKVTGDPFTFAMFTPEQLEGLKVKGDPFIYSDFTPEQLAALKGNTGDLPALEILTDKTTPVDTDKLLIEEVAVGNAKKKLTWANLIATLKTYFDTLYRSVELGYALSDQSTDISTGVKLTDRVLYPFTLTGIVGSLAVAATGGTLTVNIKKNGTSIFSTKLTFDATEASTVTAAIPAVLSITTFETDDIIEFSVDNVGGVVAGKGLIVKLIGHK